MLKCYQRKKDKQKVVNAVRMLINIEAGCVIGVTGEM